LIDGVSGFIRRVRDLHRRLLSLLLLYFFIRDDGLAVQMPSSLAPLMAARNCADHRAKFCLFSFSEIGKPNSGFDEHAIVELGSGTM
jgi:hypothetical protein